MNQALKILIVGKSRSIVHWVENTATAFTELGHHVQQFALNGTNTWQALHYKVAKRMHSDVDAIIQRDLEHTLVSYQPDIVIFIAIACLYMPETLFSLTRAICPKAHTAVWIGDRLTRAESLFANHVDHVFVTDTGFITDLRQQGFTIPSSYLPLAVDMRVFRPHHTARTARIVYVASHSLGRSTIMQSIKRPISIYGKGWHALQNTPHLIHPQRLAWRKVPQLYASSLAVLNIRNEKNVLNGLNQRSFEPYGSMTPVLNDDMLDLPLCFEPNKEILVYHNIEELHDWHGRLNSDPHLAEKVGKAGWRRVKAEHTWQHRARAILNTFAL